MKIRNNTNHKLVIYHGFIGQEEPNFRKELEVGEDFEFAESVPGTMSIQET